MINSQNQYSLKHFTKIKHKIYIRKLFHKILILQKHYVGFTNIKIYILTTLNIRKYDIDTDLINCRILFMFKHLHYYIEHKTSDLHK